MTNEAPWPRHANIIEIGTRDSRLGAALIRDGFDRYLAVCSSPELASAIQDSDSSLKGRVVASNGTDLVRHNNADALILHGTSTLAIGYWPRIKHVAWIATPLSFHAGSVTGTVLGVIRWLTGRFGWPAIISLGDGKCRLLVWRNKKKHESLSARRYVPHEVGVAGFLSKLFRDNRSHAVLRWFESLPSIAPGEDIDLLVDDFAVGDVIELLASGPGIQPIDVYSVSGLPMTDFRSLPYYPPLLAKELLDQAVVHRDLCCVPSAKHHFLSLAYHALYHKGDKSGLTSHENQNSGSKSGDHDYAAILKQLGAAVGHSGAVTLNELDEHLAAEGWRPSHDMMARLSRHNSWLRSKLAAEGDASIDNGLTVFLLREEGMHRGGVERAQRMLEESGFSILYAAELTDDASKAAATQIRGGNWGPGPWPISGGVPAAIIVAHDSKPIAPTRRQHKKYPFIVNARTLCKDQIRDEFNKSITADRHCNVIHSSDNGREALDYLRLAGLNAADFLTAAKKPNSQSTLREGVVADITKSGRRATIEVVHYSGRLAVKKTFKPHAIEYFEREVRFLRDLGGKVACIPPLLNCGDNWFMIPYYDDVLQYRRSSGKLLPINASRQAILALRDVYDAGYALIDASIDNVLIDRQEGLKLFDFEFSSRYETKPSSFEACYDIAGCPVNYAAALPIQGCNSYERNWMPYVGLSLESLLNDPTHLQQAKRAVYFAAHLHRYVPRLVRGLFRSQKAFSSIQLHPIERRDGALNDESQLQNRAA